MGGGARSSRRIHLVRPFRRTDGDSDFERFYAEAAARIYRLGWLLAGDEGEDLAAEAFAKALARWSQVSRADDPEAWVRKVLTNLHISWRRKLKRGHDIRARAEHRQVFDPIEGADDRLIVRAALEQLSARQRTTVVLFHYQGLSLREIAEIMDTSLSTQNTHLRRAHRILARVLEGGAVPDNPNPRVPEGSEGR